MCLQPEEDNPVTKHTMVHNPTLCQVHFEALNIQEPTLAS
jgi:hypothetical protein